MADAFRLLASPTTEEIVLHAQTLNSQVDPKVLYARCVAQVALTLVSLSAWRDTVARLPQAGYLCIAQNVFALPADEHAVAAIGYNVSRASPMAIRPVRLAHCSRLGSRRSAALGRPTPRTTGYRSATSTCSRAGQPATRARPVLGRYCPTTTWFAAWPS